MILSFAMALLAAQQGPSDDPNCADPQAQIEMNACAALEFQAADAALNAAWPEVLAYVRAVDRDGAPEFDYRPSGESRLREAQRAWIVFRDAHCAVAAYEARGGSMEPMTYQGCRAEVTRQRTEQLRSLIIE